MEKTAERSRAVQVVDCAASAVGWNFVFEQRKNVLRELDKWLRLRVRACVWTTRRLPRTRGSRLKQLGVEHEDALGFGCSRKKCLKSFEELRSPTGDVQLMVSRTEIVQSVRKVERACSQTTNRLVRIRMLGGVGGVRRNPTPIPIALLCPVLLLDACD